MEDRKQQIVEKIVNYPEKGIYVMKRADRIYYGGDYNPDQWDDATIDEDMRLFNRAGINLLTLPVFAWSKL